MRNIKLVVAYDGTRFLGWQKTKEGLSIEQELETVLEQILQEKVILQAGSRTDAGVHARDQVVNFRTSRLIEAKKLHISLCCLLPKDIAVISVEEMPAHFHPTLDNLGKEYHYWLCTETFQYPEHRLYSWHYPYELNVDLMREAAQILVGEHDFAAFCNFKKNEEYDHCVREITAIKIIEEGMRLRFEVGGKNFLYKMVRNIVGTLVYVGRGKIPVSELSGILKSLDRKRAGVTAPAHGLVLYKTFYGRD